MKEKDIKERKIQVVKHFEDNYTILFGEIYPQQMKAIDDRLNFANDVYLWGKVFHQYKGVSLAGGKKPSFYELFEVYNKYEDQKSINNHQCGICKNEGFVRVVVIRTINQGVKTYILKWREESPGVESKHFGFVRKFAGSRTKYNADKEHIPCECSLGDKHSEGKNQDGESATHYTMEIRQRACQRRVPSARLANEICRKIKFINEGREDQFKANLQKFDDADIEEIKVSSIATANLLENKTGE